MNRKCNRLNLQQKQLKAVFDKLDFAGRKEVWGFAGSAFSITIDVPGFAQLNYHISAEAGDKYAPDAISQKVHFKIKRGANEAMVITQKELMQRIEKIILWKK